MDKKVKKIEKSIIMNIIQYLVIIVIGALVMFNPQIGILEPVYYISIVFYIFSFITCLCYFIGRRQDDYENLLLSLINVIVASFLFLMQGKSGPDILGISIAIYTLFVIFNKLFTAYILKSKGNVLWGLKYITSLLLAFLGLLTMLNLFNEVSVVTLMFGYYFILFGIINFIEPLIETLFEFNGVKSFLKYIEGAEVVKKSPSKTVEKPVEKKETEEKSVVTKKSKASEKAKTTVEKKAVKKAVKKAPVVRKTAKSVTKSATKKVTKKVVKKTIKQPVKKKTSSKTSKKASK